MKKIFTLIIFAFILFILPSCNEIKELNAPTNFKIEETIISFDSVEQAEKYRIELYCVEDKSIIRRFVNNGDDLNNLNIQEGEYLVKIQSINQTKNLESAFSEEVSYKQKDLYAVKLIEKENLIDGKYVKWMGQTSYDKKEEANVIYYSASGFEVKVKKTDEPLTLKCLLTGTNTQDKSKQPYFVIVKDDDIDNGITICMDTASKEVNLIGEGGFSIDDNEVHTITVYKRSESIDSHLMLKRLETSGKFIDEISVKPHKMIVFAASSSTGYGNLGNSSTTKNTSNTDCLKAFAFLSSRALNSEINIVSASGWGIYASQWTSPNTICMRDRYKMVDVYSTEVWDFTKYTPDVIVTNFGTNDESYIRIAGTEKEKQTRTENFIKYYVDFLNELHTTYPQAKIVIIYGLMCESNIYDEHQIIFDTAKSTIPDLTMLKVQGDQAGCNSHPSVSSHKKISEELSNHIKQVMGW